MHMMVRAMGETSSLASAGPARDSPRAPTGGALRHLRCKAATDLGPRRRARREDNAGEWGRSSPALQGAVVQSCEILSEMVWLKRERRPASPLGK